MVDIEAVERVAHQIRSECPCFADLDDLPEEERDKALVPITRSLIRMLSLATCWTIETCGSLLFEPREERVELGCYNFSCCEPIYRFRPYFQANITDVVIEVLVENGLSTENIQLTEDQFKVTDIHGYTEILINMRDFGARCACANECEMIVLKISYMAGYELLPDCLFPDLCEVLRIISASITGCGSLAECCTMTQPALDSRLKSKRVGELSWSWEKDTDSTEYVFRQLIMTNRLKSLAMLSLCGTNRKTPSIWAVYANEVTKRRETSAKRRRYCIEDDCIDD